MKQIFNIFFIISLLVDCASESGENNNAFQLILGIVNQQPLTLNHSDRKSSELVIIDIPMHYVDSISGNDSNAGTKSAPYRTITKAILASKADGTKVIYVAPGTYDTSIGETFPISIPDGVNLYGDYDGKGLVGGSSSFYAGPPGTTPKTGPTWIKGGGSNSPHINTTIIPKNNSQIAGFKITNPNPEGPEGDSTRGISMQNFVSIKIRNNTITGMPVGVGIHFEFTTVTDVGSNTISGNQITYNYHGIIDHSIRASYDKVENNFISRNYIGIDTTRGLDLGQGPAESAGNNTISCNSYEDIWIPGSSNGNDPQVLFAMNNYWDHFAPTMSSTHIDGLDIRNYSNTTLVYYAGGGVAPNACN